MYLVHNIDRTLSLSISVVSLYTDFLSYIFFTVCIVSLASSGIALRFTVQILFAP